MITIVRPDDWHVHLRDGDALRDVLAHTAQRFARAIVMPNVQPPVTTTERAKAYRERVLRALPKGMPFRPLMTLYLTDNTPVEEIVAAKQSGIVHGVKYYPAGATTNSDSGVTIISRCYAAIEAMQELGMPLLVHGEVTDTDIFDREKVFLDRVLAPLVERFPRLRIVLEHVTTEEGVRFVESAGAGKNIAATITAHHLLLNRDALFAGGIRPHHYCLPVLKRERDRMALLAAATSGNPKFFLGSDSAPHAKSAKESAFGCAGIFTSHAAIELYAEAFEQMDALDKLEGFASLFGADFYGLPRNPETITLAKESWQVPGELPFGEETLVPFRAGETVTWKLQE